MFWVVLDRGSVIIDHHGQRDCFNGKPMDSLRMSYVDPQMMLFDAIFGGDLKQVKELIDSGVDKYSVLHHPVKWEGATVLAAASCEGYFDIVKYLIDVGTSVNCTDPCIGRNPLHWACKGNQYQIAKYLLDCGVNVNRPDKNNITPLIQATICRNCDLVKLIIERGANVNHQDRLRCSALHYACLYGDSNLVKEIITGGCINNNKTFIGRGTPLASLVYNQDKDNVALLLESGYDMSNEIWLQQAQETNLKVPIDLFHLVNFRYRNPSSLKELCRCVVRKSVKGTKVQDKIRKLNLPTVICRFLRLEPV